MTEHPFERISFEFNSCTVRPEWDSRGLYAFNVIDDHGNGCRLHASELQWLRDVLAELARISADPTGVQP